MMKIFKIVSMAFLVTTCLNAAEREAVRGGAGVAVATVARDSATIVTLKWGPGKKDVTFERVSAAEDMPWGRASGILGDESGGAVSVGSSVAGVLAEDSVLKNVIRYVYRRLGSAATMVATGEVYVQFDPSLSMDEREKILTENALSLEKQNSDHGYITMVINGADPVRVAQNLQKTGGVVIAEPDFLMKIVGC